VPTAGLLLYFVTYFLPIVINFELWPNSVRCPSYWPGPGKVSCLLLFPTVSLIKAAGTLGFVITHHYNISYAPNGGFESGFQTYFPPIVILFVLKPKSFRCPSYCPGAGDYSDGLLMYWFLVIIAEGIVGFVNAAR
jgi:hypothetical protein